MHTHHTTIYRLFAVIIVISFTLVSQLSAKQKDYLIFRGDYSYPPFEFLNENNEPDGFNPEIIKAIAHHMDIRYSLRLGNWSQVRTELENGKIDALLGMYYTPERSYKIDFTVPIFTTIHSIFVRKGSEINNIDDLKGKTIIVQKGDIAHDYFIDNSITEHLIVKNDIADVLDQLSFGNGDAAIIATLQGKILLKNRGISNLEVVNSPILQSKYCLAVKKGNSELLAKLNEGLSIIKGNGEYDKIHKKWLNHLLYEEWSIKSFTTLYYQYILLVIIIILNIIISYLIIKKQTDKIRNLLSKKNLELTATLDSIRDAVIKINMEGYIIDINSVGLSLFEHSREEILNTHIEKALVLTYINNNTVVENLFVKILSFESKLKQLNNLILMSPNGKKHIISITTIPISGHNDVNEGIVLTLNNITDVMKFREQLIEEKNNISTIIDNSPSLICGIGPDDLITFINPTVEKITGYTEEELLGENWWKKLYPGESYRQATRLVSNLSQGDVSDYLMTLTCKDGTQRTISWNSKTFRDNNYEIVKHFGFGHDLTERIKFQEALRYSEERFRAAFDSTQDCILIWNHAYEYQYANKAAVSKYALDENNYIGSNLSDHDNNIGQNHDLWQTRIDKIFNQNETLRVQDVYEVLQSKYYVDTIISPIRQEDGSVIAACAVFRDITELEKTKNALHESETNYRTLFEAAGDGIFLIENDKIINCNTQTLSIFNCKREDIIGKSVLDFSPEKQPDGALSKIKAFDKIYSANLGTHQIFEWVHRTKDKVEFYSEISLMPVELEDKHFVQAIIRDISNRKQLEEKLHKELYIFETMDKINSIIKYTTDSNEMLKQVIASVLEIYNCDRAWLLYPCDPQSSHFKVPIESFKPEYPGASISGDDFTFQMTEEISDACNIALNSNKPATYHYKNGSKEHNALLERFSIQTQLIHAVRPIEGQPWLFGMHQCSYNRIWTDTEVDLFDAISQRLTDALSNLTYIKNIQQSESKFRGLVESTSDIIWEINHNQEYTYVSPQIENILGYSQEEVLGKLIFDFMTEESKNNLFTSFSCKNRFECNIISEEKTCRNSEQELVSLEMNASPIYDEDSYIIGFRGIDRDISTKKQFEKRLAQSEEQFRILMEQSPISIQIHDRNGLMVKVNKAWLDLWEVSSSNVVEGKYNVFEDKQAEEMGLTDSLKKAFYGEEVNIYNIDYTPKDSGNEGEQKIVNVKAYPLKHPDGSYKHIVIFNEDVTERKRAEQKILEVNESLEEKVKIRTENLESVNKELDDFAYIISHDMKAPLRGISQLSTWLKTDYENVLDADGKETLDLLVTRVSKMSGMIDSVLEYSRAGRMINKDIDVDLNELVKEIIDILIVPAHISIHIDSNLPILLVDQTKIEQIFQNLISNAVKYSDKPKGLIQVKHEIKNESHLFSVIDNGLGIAEKYHNSIFDMFTKLDNIDGSTGIGLTIVQKIIHSYGGKVWVESQIGKGAAFYFSIPINKI